ncbi:hypothetical protein Micbo1qcDRAFT_616 [Microdochium bolleyi]|uniref:Uncharacterized protein n=1 Tax=Microdochium bolleyi TaxID=196109 RepID=A0A136JGW4_9PEZI|nr:hypothetical protein Micbo1qcDRAFT_616 [Microdochium bolleyi]
MREAMRCGYRQRTRLSCKPHPSPLLAGYSCRSRAWQSSALRRVWKASGLVSSEYKTSPVPPTVEADLLDCPGLPSITSHHITSSHQQTNAHPSQLDSSLTRPSVDCASPRNSKTTSHTYTHTHTHTLTYTLRLFHTKNSHHSR